MKNQENAQDDYMDIVEDIKSLNITDTGSDEQGIVDKMVDDDITNKKDTGSDEQVIVDKMVDDDITTNNDTSSELKEEKEIETAKFELPPINNEAVNNEMSSKTDDSQMVEGNPEDEENTPDLIENDPMPCITSEELNKEKLKLVHKEEDIKIEGYNTELNSSSNKTEFVGEGEATPLEEDNGDYEGNVVVSVTEAQLIQQKSHLVHKEGDIKIEGYTHDSEEEAEKETSSDTDPNQSSVLGTNVDSDAE